MVRFADGPMTEVSLEIPATPAAVWPMIVDIEFPVDGSAELQGTEWLDGADAPAVGARFRGHNRRGESAWSTECTITEFDVGRRFTWVVGDVADAIATWGFELAPVGEDATALRQWVRLGPGRSGVTWAIKQNPDAEEEIVAGRLDSLAKSMQRNLQAVHDSVV